MRLGKEERNMFKWEKRQDNPCISLEQINHPWMESHTQLAVPYILSNGNIRIFYNSRTKGKARPAFADLDRDTLQVVQTSKAPLLDFGKPGTFDDSGVMFSSLIDSGDKLYMYYSGWNVPATVRYHNSIGLAISEDGGNTFYKYSEGPILDRSVYNPIMVAGPYVIRRGAADWVMYYLSCSDWIDGGSKLEPVYDLHYALSKDGISWEVSNGMPCISGKNEAIAQPCVIKEGGRYYMWYSYRKTLDYRINRDNSYRIGYAESEDGINWERMDEMAGIAVSETGWDSEMIEYPYVLKVKDKYMMFYNGNGFGRSGIGIAVSEKLV